jgi:tripartite-type tricarboxylate transporter receptor subunit TctC
MPLQRCVSSSRRPFQSRNRAGGILGGLAAMWLTCLPVIAHGQAYPTRPVRIVVAFTAGGTTDILARSIGQQLSERLRQPFVIENKPGAGGNIGTEAVVRSAPDGYTLIVDSVGPIAVNPTLYKGLSYNPLTDLVPIVQIADVPNVLVVHPSLGVKNFPEFIAYAKANPGKLNYGSTGIGTSSHLSGYMLCKRVGIDATHIPYKGADALTDLLSGRVQFMFATIPSVIQHIQAGKLLPIAVSSAKRSRSLPGVPTVIEGGLPGFEAG